MPHFPIVECSRENQCHCAAESLPQATDIIDLTADEQHVGSIQETAPNEQSTECSPTEDSAAPIMPRGPNKGFATIHQFFANNFS